MLTSSFAFQAFATNIALALILAFGVRVAAARLDGGRPRAGAAAKGALFGGAAVLCMAFPIEVAPGVIVDLRSLMVFLAGPFGGPLASLVAGALAGAYRLYLGGLGMAAGTGAVVTAAALGALAAWRVGRLDSLAKEVAAGASLLLTLPWFLAIDGIAFGVTLLETLALPYAVFYVGGTVLLSQILMIDIRRQEAEQGLQQSLQRFQDMTGLASDWFWEMDAALRFTYFSPRFERLTGLRVSECVGLNRADLIADVDPEALAAHKATLARHEPFHEFRYQIRTAHGERRFVTTSGVPVFDAEGRFTGYRGIGRDITADMARARDLEAARAEAEAANHAKSGFLAAMSHELRTPLNAILGFSEILKEEQFGPHSSPRYREYAGHVHDAGTHLLSLVNDILDLAKIESGRRELEREACDPAQTIDFALRLIGQRAEGKGVAIARDIKRGSLQAYWDTRAVHQILLNILGNAVKFTPPGGTVRLDARQDPAADHGRGAYAITVADNGPGIPETDIPRLFEAFAQARGRNDAAEGTGLGLPIARALAEAHDGTIALSSRAGEGTRVRIELPLASRNAAATAETPFTALSA